MRPSARPIRLLLAEDDPDDQLLIREALAESRIANELDIVSDGEELLEYLRRGNGFGHLSGQALPGLILLDLNMPRLDGRQALREIKADPELRRIPVVVLTTSRAEEDVLRTYDLGVNSFVTKPLKFDDLVEVVRALGRYWLEIVELPTA
jgi:CheY-like chemotaxis protein